MISPEPYEPPAALVAQGLLARWQAMGLHAVQLAKGDPDRGQILVSIEQLDGRQSLYGQRRDANFRLVWQPLLAEGAFVEAQAVAAKIAAERQADPDLWVIVLELDRRDFNPELHLA